MNSFQPAHHKSRSTTNIWVKMTGWGVSAVPQVQTALFANHPKSSTPARRHPHSYGCSSSFRSYNIRVGIYLPPKIGQRKIPTPRFSAFPPPPSKLSFRYNTSQRWSLPAYWSEGVCAAAATAAGGEESSQRAAMSQSTAAATHPNPDTVGKCEKKKKGRKKRRRRSRSRKRNWNLQKRDNLRPSAVAPRRQTGGN